MRRGALPPELVEVVRSAVQRWWFPRSSCTMQLGHQTNEEELARAAGSSVPIAAAQRLLMRSCRIILRDAVELPATGGQSTDRRSRPRGLAAA